MNEDLRLGFASNDFAGTKWKKLTGTARWSDGTEMVTLDYFHLTSVLWGVCKVCAGPAQPDGRNGGRLRPPDPGRNPGNRQHCGGGGGHGGFGAAAEARVPRRRGRRRHANHPGRGAAGAHAHHARQFLVRSNSQSSVALASFTVGGFQLEGYAMTRTSCAPTR